MTKTTNISYSNIQIKITATHLNPNKFVCFPSPQTSKSDQFKKHDIYTCHLKSTPNENFSRI
jgi:hypothetical protein